MESAILHNSNQLFFFKSFRDFWRTRKDFCTNKLRECQKSLRAMSKIFFEFANKLLGDVKNLEKMSKKTIDLNSVVSNFEKILNSDFMLSNCAQLWMAISQPISGIGWCFKWEILYLYEGNTFDMGSFTRFRVPRELVVSTYQTYSRVPTV